MIGTRPIGLTEANAFVARWHSHHDPVVQHRWSLGAYADGRLAAVVIVEEPKAAALRGALEVTRLATDRTPHVASKLLGRVRRDAIETGWRRLVSYTRIDEDGKCYRAAGWWPVALVKGREWTTGNKATRWLPGFYEPSTEIVDRVRWETGPDALPELAELAHLGRRMSHTGSHTGSNISGKNEPNRDDAKSETAATARTYEVESAE